MRIYFSFQSFSLDMQKGKESAAEFFCYNVESAIKI